MRASFKGVLMCIERAFEAIAHLGTPPVSRRTSGVYGGEQMLELRVSAFTTR